MNARTIPITSPAEPMSPQDKKAHRSRLSNQYRSLADTLQRSATELRQEARTLDRLAFQQLERANAIENGQISLFDDE